MNSMNEQKPSYEDLERWMACLEQAIDDMGGPASDSILEYAKELFETE